MKLKMKILKNQKILRGHVGLSAKTRQALGVEKGDSVKIFGRRFVVCFAPKDLVEFGFAILNPIDVPTDYSSMEAEVEHLTAQTVFTFVPSLNVRLGRVGMSLATRQTLGVEKGDVFPVEGKNFTITLIPDEFVGKDVIVFNPADLEKLERKEF